jgi:hypothetical protein
LNPLLDPLKILKSDDWFVGKLHMKSLDYSCS